MAGTPPKSRPATAAIARALALALAVLAAACGGGGSGTTASAPGVPVGGFKVARLDQTFVDTRRPTPANNEAPAQPSRTLQTTVHYPDTAEGGPFPLVIFAHGFTASPAAYQPLLDAWAAAGYVVAAPAFPLSNGQAPGGPTQNDIVNQPGDVSFLITELTALRDGPLAGRIDASRVGVAGHSMGGVTTLGVFANTCCRDDRVRAAIVMAGNEVPLPDGKYTVRDSTPSLFIHGDADDLIAVGRGREAFAHAPAPKFFVTLIGAGHSPPFGGRTENPTGEVVVRTTIDFFDHYLKGEAASLGRLKADAVVTGVADLQAVER